MSIYVETLLKDIISLSINLYKEGGLNKKMILTRKVRFEYYAVVYRNKSDQPGIPDRPFDLLQWFDKIRGLSLAERTYDYYQERARLDKIYYDDKDKLWGLHFLRLRDTNLPSKATIDTEAEPLELEDNEYIGEDVSAIYDDKLHVLMCQRNRDSLSPTGIESYLNLVWGKDAPIAIYLRPIVSRDVMERARRAAFYRKITIRFADLRKENFTGISPLKVLIEEFGKYNAVSAEVNINLGYVRGETLTPETIRDTIHDIETNTKIIKRAELSTKDNDDANIETLDLFEDKMHDIENITLRDKRTLTHDDIVGIMKEIFKRKWNQIAQIMLGECELNEK